MHGSVIAINEQTGTTCSFVCGDRAYIVQTEQGKVLMAEQDSEEQILVFISIGFHPKFKDGNSRL